MNRIAKSTQTRDHAHRRISGSIYGLDIHAIYFNREAAEIRVGHVSDLKLGSPESQVKCVFSQATAVEIDATTGSLTGVSGPDACLLNRIGFHLNDPRLNNS